MTNSSTDEAITMHENLQDDRETPLSRNYATIAAAVLLSMGLSFVASGVAIAIGFGVRDGYLIRWLAAWLASWTIALPLLVIALPAVKRMVEHLVDPADSAHLL